MTRTYSSRWYRLDHTDGYLIWFSNDADGFITAPNRTLPSFRNLESLRAYAATQRIELDAMELDCTDLDVVGR